MIGLGSFIVISICVYLLVFFLLPKTKFPYIVKILLASFIGGHYLNIADEGSVAKWLDIELTDTIRLLSMIIVYIYLLSIWFMIIKPEGEKLT